MKKQIKILGLLLVMFLITSCNDMLLKKDNLEGYSYTITNIENFGNHYSRYFATLDVNYVYYKNNINFIDKKGKFVTGDTIQIKTELFNEKEN